MPDVKPGAAGNPAGVGAAGTPGEANTDMFVTREEYDQKFNQLYGGLSNVIQMQKESRQALTDLAAKVSQPAERPAYNPADAWGPPPSGDGEDPLVTVSQLRMAALSAAALAEEKANKRIEEALKQAEQMAEKKALEAASHVQEQLNWRQFYRDFPELEEFPELPEGLLGRLANDPSVTSKSPREQWAHLGKESMKRLAALRGKMAASTKDEPPAPVTVTSAAGAPASASPDGDAEAQQAKQWGDAERQQVIAEEIEARRKLHEARMKATRNVTV